MYGIEGIITSNEFKEVIKECHLEKEGKVEMKSIVKFGNWKYGKKEVVTC